VDIGNVLGIHEQALLVRNKRAEMLASNIANADTPGYKARDIDFRKVLQQQSVANVRLQATKAGHIQPSSGPVSTNQMQYRIPDQASLDGNTVDMQHEQLQFSDNNMRFSATMRFLNGKIASIKAALKGQ
jgi:flagellar basal-body rod protein FlgB